MSEIAVLDEATLRAAVPLDLAAVACIERAFAALAGEGVVMPPVLSMHLPQVNGEVDIKTAFLPGFSGFAVKVSPGFFDNPSRGLPSTSGLMVLFSAETGRVQAVLLDNGYLTDVRTAAAGAVAARALAREDATSAAILGAGTQARMQLEALCLVRPIDRAVIWARDPAKAERAAAGCAARLGIPVTAATDARDAVSGADIVVTTTPATSPILRGDWLQPGQHVTAMGSDQPGKSELDPACLQRAQMYVPDRQSQATKMGELRAAIDAGVVAPDHVFAELGEVVRGAAPGRFGPDDITIADLTGTGVQDTAIATHALAAVAKKEDPS
ncbi:ornithine cyclodeaminase family protein [Sulfitobacter alexandrii]|uniref:Ornithine cyclodeaminase family protein n=1 Tax=Sulfitobacter alexandrii TaxID=1917485 RepID=A0A1J0WJS3_9RHOB|nr:cyclodeaminase [Sulfitobacter alexandrii]APE44591.1 ornithine cyclodeaminase family protein [Sulfitobacter alexandrii]